jgi:glycosyltransferase involved in cell wall biosynthesis
LSPSPEPKRVCLLTTSHPVSYTRFFDREAVSLARAGCAVTLVGLGPRDSEETRDGVRLVALQEQKGTSKLRLLLRLRRVPAVRECDVLHCLDPWALAIGLARPRVKLIYEAVEWFPQTYLDRTSLPGPVRRSLASLVSLLEFEACRRAGAIIDTNQTRAARFERPGRKPVIVGNYPPAELLPEPSASPDMAIAWTGLISRERGFEQLLEAFSQVASEFESAQLRVIGQFDPRDKIERRTRCVIDCNSLWGRVEFLGSLPYDAVFRELSRCLVGVILLQPGRGNDYTGQPNKLFEFMGSGLAVIASDFPEIGSIVRESGCGWLLDPTRPNSIADALRQALSSPSECRRRGLLGRKAVLERYTWREAEKALLRAYEETAK